MRSRHAKTFALLCLLILQVQQTIATALPCLHGNTAGVEISDCPLHAVSQAATAASAPDASEPGSLLDCQRCALTCAVGAQNVTTASPTLSALFSPVTLLVPTADFPVDPSMDIELPPPISGAL